MMHQIFFRAYRSACLCVHVCIPWMHPLCASTNPAATDATITNSAVAVVDFMVIFALWCSYNRFNCFKVVRVGKRGLHQESGEVVVKIKRRRAVAGRR
jgi:hypothetical protein